MPDLTSIPTAAWVFYALILTFAAGVYAQAVWHTTRFGAKVRTDQLALPELLMSMVLAGTFLLLMAGAILRQDRGEAPVKIETVLPSSLVFVVLCVGILAFLHFARHLRLPLVFGLDQVPPLKILGWAAGLCAAAIPLTHFAGLLTMFVLKDKFAPQPLVELFSQMARQNDHVAVAKIVAVGAFLAPCCEEFLFRGFCYGVWKRYLGPLGAGFLSSLLFAALHTSLPAFASLFVLAVCLNIAYERTGSLLVPIGLHASFNFLSLLVLYVQARFPVVHVSP